MLSIFLSIASAVMLIAGVAYFVFQELPYAISFFNNMTSSAVGLIDSLPEFLVPFAGFAIIIAVASLIVKLL